MQSPWSGFDKDVVQKVYPEGDFRQTSHAMERKFESLMGLLKQEQLGISRQEIEGDKAIKQESHDERWKHDREVAIERRSKEAFMAKRSDSQAWTDEEGYSSIRETPTFRDGFNSTLRIKPPPEAHLHNGLKTLKERTQVRAPSTPSHQVRFDETTIHKKREPSLHTQAPKAVVEAGAAARSQDVIHRALSKRDDLAKMLGEGFINAILGGYSSSTAPRDISTSHSREEVQLLLRMLQELERQKPEAGREGFAGGENSRQETLFTSLGKACIDIGLTLPAGKRDDPLRNDSVALSIGMRALGVNAFKSSRETPLVNESMKKDIAIAIGRVILHLKQAAGLEGMYSKPNSQGLEKDRTVDGKTRESHDSSQSFGSKSTELVHDADKDRTLVQQVGKLTLQFIFAASGKKLDLADREVSKRHENLITFLGSKVLSDVNNSTAISGMLEKDRVREELSVKLQNSAVSGFAANSSKSVDYSKSFEGRAGRTLLPSSDVAPLTPRETRLR